MLVCLLRIEEGTAGCLFTAQRVQQQFPNKKSHPRNKLSAQLPHGMTRRRRSRDFRKLLFAGNCCPVLHAELSEMMADRLERLQAGSQALARRRLG